MLLQVTELAWSWILSFLEVLSPLLHPNIRDLMISIHPYSPLDPLDIATSEALKEIDNAIIHAIGGASDLNAALPVLSGVHLKSQRVIPLSYIEKTFPLLRKRGIISSETFDPPKPRPRLALKRLAGSDASQLFFTSTVPMSRLPINGSDDIRTVHSFSGEHIRL